MNEVSRGSVAFRLPPWLPDQISRYKAGCGEDDRMLFVIDTARRNIVENTGGPFAAGVFEMNSGRLVSLGVNLVTTEKLSTLHAEMVALMVAQRNLQTYDLGGSGMALHELFTSAEPCAMCFGAIPWSGVRRVVSGARCSDAMAIGFDEGPKTAAWREELKARGIDTLCDVQRESAIDVFREYAARGGRIYNSREAV